MPPSIEVLEHHVVWENPTPTFSSRHAYFPGMVRLPGGQLLAMFPIGQAFESADQVIHLSRSADDGRSWTPPAPLHERYRPGLGCLKPTLLDDGTLIALGYAFYADDGRWLNHQTGGCPGGLNLVSRSTDGGRSWTLPAELPHRYPEVLEISGPCIQLQSGDLVALGTPIPVYDGTRPSGAIGIALRSSDRGRQWDDSTIYFRQPPVSPLEARLAQLDDGRLVAIVWALDESSGVCHNNMITISHDDGRMWSPPIDTGVAGQAASVLARPGARLLSIHAQREQDPVGVLVRVVDLAGDRWTTLAAANVWDRAEARKVGGYADMGANVKFGQPSLLHLAGDQYLAYHWAIEDGQGRILAHRLRIQVEKGKAMADTLLGGVLPVFQTPYHADESIDFETLATEINWLYDRGADGIVLAMVSEVLRLSSAEREQLAAAACRFGCPRGAVVISVGAESAHSAVHFARHAEAAGATAVMAIPPVCVVLPDDELYDYYGRIVEAVDVPVIVQDASGYVGRPVPVAVQARLLDTYGPQRVQYKPEALPIGPRLTELLKATAGQARVFEGSGGIALVDSYRRGIVGTMPGADLIDSLVALWRALEQGDDERAYAIHGPLAALVSLQTSLDAFIAVEKYLLVGRGVLQNQIVRGPVGYRLDDETKAEVDRLYQRLARAIG